MWRNLFFFICFIAGIPSSIAQRAFTDDQLEYYFPKKEVKYKLSSKPFTLSDTNIVSTNAVYVKTSERVYWENYQIVKKSVHYSWIRFFQDGRVFISFPYISYPTIEEFNDLSYGKYGRYIIKDDGEIVIEFYQNRQYGVMFMFAQKISTGIQFYATSYRLRPLIKNRSTDDGFYRKDYTTLYNWPPS